MTAIVAQPRLQRPPLPPTATTAVAGSVVATVAIYVRLTRDESLKGLSAEAQVENCTAYARRAGLGPVVVYQELKAVGGDVPFDQRDAGRRLVDDIRAGRVKHVLVRDTDRLTRSVRLWIDFEELCREYGVTIHTLSGPLANKSPTDKFAGRVRAVAAELEKDQVGDRVRRVKRQMAITGRHAGGPPPFGYTSQARRKAELVATGLPDDEARAKAEVTFPLRGHLYVDEGEAKVVRLVFDCYVGKRWGVRRIANWLNQQGHRRRTGLLWCGEKVRRRVNDPAVAGLIAYDEAFFEAQRGRRTAKCRQQLHKGRHDPIVPEEVWRRAQQIKAANTCEHLGKGKAAYANRRYALSGILRCPTCGSLMAAKSARRGKAFGYYVCSRKKYRGAEALGGCTFPAMNTAKVDQAFWSCLSGLIAGEELIDRVHAAATGLIESRERERADRHDVHRVLQKVNADLAIWYCRHDEARSEAEQEAAWRRIVELTERAKQLTASAGGREAERPRPEPVSRERVARYLKSLGALVGQTEDAGKAFVTSLAEHHGLAVVAKDATTLTVGLKLRPPNSEGEADAAQFAVEVEGDARLPADQITAWVEEQRAKAAPCACGCGRPVEINRRHYWVGLPEFRSGCRHKGMARRRWELAKGLYTGQRVADLLGIGRTTVGHWVKAGKLPKPTRSISGMLLFDPAAIDRLVAARKGGRRVAG